MLFTYFTTTVLREDKVGEIYVFSYVKRYVCLDEAII